MSSMGNKDAKINDASNAAPDATTTEPVANSNAFLVQI